MTHVQPNRRFAYRFIKRTADIAFSLFGLIVLSPLFVVIAVAALFYPMIRGKKKAKEANA